LKEATTKVNETFKIAKEKLGKYMYSTVIHLSTSPNCEKHNMIQGVGVAQSVE